MSGQRLNPISWTEGMFLRPQHLQHHDLALQQRIDYYLSAIDPFHWGVRDLLLNEEALSEHRVEILRLDAVLPGGTIVRYPGSAVVEAREFDPDQQAVDVHIGVRRLSAAEPHSAPSGNGTREVRYKVVSENLPDLQRGGSEAPIDVLVPNVRVFLSGEETELDTHESLLLARVVATGEVKVPFALSRTYAPPLLALQACTHLDEEVRQVVSQLAAKVAVIATGSEAFSLSELPRMIMRYTLARMTPVIRHLLSTGATRPFELYTALVETAAALSAFREKEVPSLPPYAHDDLYSCYHQLLELIDVHLEEVAPTFRELKLEFDPAGQFYVTKELTVADVDPRNQLTLSIGANMDSKELVGWVEEKGKAGSAGSIPGMVKVSLAGLRLAHLPGPPTTISGPGGAEFWKIEPHGNPWNKVREEFTFGISLGPLTDADVRLFISSDGA